MTDAAKADGSRNGSNEQAQVEFALMGHPSTYAHMGDIIQHSSPSYSDEKLRKYEATLSKFFEWMPSYAARNPLSMTGPDGQRLEGRLIICTFLPDKMTSPRHMLNAYKKIRDGCVLAQELGAKVVGLGGFTSIMDGSQGEKIGEDLEVAVTSGNSLTAALAVAQVEALLARLGWDLADHMVAVLGGTGDIGKACALSLARRARRMLVVGRNAAKLEAFRAEMPPHVQLHTSTNVQDATEASVIIAATSASQPVLSEADLRPGTIVCDVGYPKNMSYSPDPRPDVLVISGGLAEMPSDMDIRYLTRLPTARLMYGCFSEAMVLAMSGRYERFSTGQGRITQEKMDSILELARANGFAPAPPYRGSLPVTDEMIETFLGLSSGLLPEGAMR
ncbi:MAG TPA: NAD(P)-binding domain-containing protein [Chloroflexia bacterium]